MAGPSNEKDLDVNKYEKDDSLEPSKTDLSANKRKVIVEGLLMNYV